MFEILLTKIIFAGRCRGCNVILHNCIYCKLYIAMPQISRFYGIIILMNFNDHLPPHFHAWYNDYKIIVNIADGEISGNMPARALRLILEWWDINKDVLMETWNKAHSGVPLGTIEPLK
jgi:hypothetical protein